MVFQLLTSDANWKVASLRIFLRASPDSTCIPRQNLSFFQMGTTPLTLENPIAAQRTCSQVPPSAFSGSDVLSRSNPPPRELRMPTIIRWESCHQASNLALKVSIYSLIYGQQFDPTLPALVGPQNGIFLGSACSKCFSLRDLKFLHWVRSRVHYGHHLMLSFYKGGSPFTSCLYSSNVTPWL